MCFPCNPHEKITFTINVNYYDVFFLFFNYLIFNIVNTITNIYYNKYYE